MEINEYQKWISDFYKSRGWYQLGVFERVAFLCEETGEVARSVRAMEIGRDRPDEVTHSKEILVADLAEELGDVLANIFVLADKYNISFEDILISHKLKLQARFKAEALNNDKKNSLSK